MSRRDLPALLADVVLVLVFAAIGRAEHERGNPILGVLETAWPFLVGVGVGWLLVTLGSKQVPLGIGPGITVWLSTLVIGMVLRQVSGDGTALSFIVVATLVLGVLLVGWRAARALWLRSREADAVR